MNCFTNKKSTKILIIMLVITIMTSFIVPNKVYADDDTTYGGKLFKPIAQLVCGLGDGIIMALQKYFLGSGEIQQGEITEIERTDYKIRYSPGIIFSNTVPGLYANFINPDPNIDLEAKTLSGNWIVKGDYKIGDDALKKIGLNLQYDGDGILVQPSDNSYVIEIVHSDDLMVDDVSTVISWTDKNTNQSYKLINTEIDWNDTTMSDASFANLAAFVPLVWHLIRDQFDSTPWTLYELQGEAQPILDSDGNQVVIKSSASILQRIISKWYKALRLIALVGLLSVLVYVGIRIIISSTGQEKAKYKKMIGDWLIAICILFVLQYIMSFTTTIVDELIEIFPEVQGQEGEDMLMSNIRNKIASGGGDFWNVLGETVIYVALVVLTCVFTIHYLKRFVYLAFFTMIAPLIALTYPLDKIKDGQAQAFGMWIKEYVFNSLIPVIHLLLYTIFVTSANELIDINPIYAVVCIGFIIPAEKFIRKMFGFDKATTSGQLGAAAGGAMVMNAINKISHAGGNSGGKGSKSGSGSSGGANSSPARISNRPDGGSPDQNSPNPDPLDNSNPAFKGGDDGLGGTTAGVTNKPKRGAKRSNKWSKKFRKTVF